MGYGFKICGRRHEEYTPPPPKPFDQGLDAIAEKIDQWYAGTISDLSQYFSVGDITYISLPKFPYTEVKRFNHDTTMILYAPPATVGMRIIGINHDTLTSAYGGKTKAALTLQLSPYVYSGTQLKSDNSPSTNPNGFYCDIGSGINFAWHLSTEYRALNGTMFFDDFLTVMPTQLKNRIKAVNKSTRCIGSNGVAYEGSTSDKVFLLSYTELTGSSPGQETGTQYAYFADTSHNYSDGVSVWTRTVDGGSSSIPTGGNQYYVEADTRTIYTATSTWLGLGHSFCFCI